MPTLQQWMDALTTPRSVKIESSHVLLASIQAKQVQQNALLQAKGHPPAFAEGAR